VNGRTRVYYTVTRTGEKRLAGLVRQWTHLTDTVSRAIRETSNVPATI
jgi:DNA-binding PadR family transcriptional regulator